MDRPLMPKATAVWLVENTALTFKQIADFTGLHELEVQGIADGEVAQGIKGFDPIANNQLDREEIEKGEKDPNYRLKLKKNPLFEAGRKRKGPRYTPLSKRQERPSAILWLVKYHPELSDAQICKLVGTTKPTVKAIRERTHWNINEIQPVDPVALGFCRQTELDEAVRKAAKKKQAEGGSDAMSDEERAKLVSTEESLADREARIPSAIAGLEDFSLTGSPAKPAEEETVDPESLFNLPRSGEGEEKD